jgi:HAMP domain-containing protein
VFDQNFNLLLDRLNALSLPGAASVAAALRNTHATLITKVAASDAALRLKLTQRDPAALKAWASAALAQQEAQFAANDFITNALLHIDPVVDQLLRLERAIWDMGVAAESEAQRLALAVGAERSWSAEDIAANDEERTRRDLAWEAVSRELRRPDAPLALVAAAERIRQVYFGFVGSEQAALRATLRSGHKANQSVWTWQQKQNAAIDPLQDAAIATMQAILDRAVKQLHIAQRGLIVNGLIGGLVVMHAASGIVIARRRVSGPIIGLAASMHRLAMRDIAVDIPGLGRRDEIGAMAESVAVFRSAMIQTDELDALAAKQIQAEHERDAAAAAEIAAMSAAQSEVVETMAFGLMNLAEGNLAFQLTLPLTAE